MSTFDAMVTAISSLANQAMDKFDQQHAAAASLATTMNDAITTMRESAALTEAMREKYVQQTLMVDGATGQLIDDWSCSRTKHWELHFNTSRYASLARPKQGLGEQFGLGMLLELSPTQQGCWCQNCSDYTCLQLYSVPVDLHHDIPTCRLEACYCIHRRLVVCDAADGFAGDIVSGACECHAEFADRKQTFCS